MLYDQLWVDGDAAPDLPHVNVGLFSVLNLMPSTALNIWVEQVNRWLEINLYHL